MRKHRGILIYTAIALIVSVAFSVFVTNAAVSDNFNQEFCVYYDGMQSGCRYLYGEIALTFAGAFYFIGRLVFVPTAIWLVYQFVAKAIKLMRR